MLYKKYGKTDKMVSAIGFGGMRFEENDYKNGNLDKCAQLVIEAYNRGINYFDTAPGYCSDMSEKIIGHANSQMKKTKEIKPYYISTKCALWHGTTADDLQRRLELSLNALQTDKIDMYNLWCIKTLEEYRQVTKKGGLYDGAIKAKDEGLISHVCFTTHMSGKEIVQVAFDGLFEGVTMGYNAINSLFRQEGVDGAYASEMGIVTMNPLGGGIIPNHKDYFSFLKLNSEDSVVTGALKFITSQPEITSALVGFNNLSELDEAILATKNLYTGNFKEEIKSYLSQELNSICTSCGYCDSCPVELPVPKLMDSYNQYILSGDEKNIYAQLKNHWGISSDIAGKCIQCKKCERLCTQKLPIIDRLNYITNNSI